MTALREVTTDSRVCWFRGWITEFWDRAAALFGCIAQYFMSAKWKALFLLLESDYLPMPKSISGFSKFFPIQSRKHFG